MRIATSIGTLLTMAAITIAAPAGAQEGAGDALLDSVTRCRALAVDSERLACYDRAVGDLARVRADNGLAVLSREEVRQKRRSLFGLPLPNINLFGRTDDKIPQVDSLESTVTGMAASGRDGFTLTFADKSVWRTVERGRFDPKVGATVRVRRAALGSYLASFDKQRSIRIERVR